MGPACGPVRGRAETLWRPSQGWAAVTQPPPHRTHPPWASPGGLWSRKTGRKRTVGLAGTGATTPRKRVLEGRRGMGWGPQNVLLGPSPSREPFLSVTGDPDPGRAALRERVQRPESEAYVGGRGGSPPREQRAPSPDPLPGSPRPSRPRLARPGWGRCRWRELRES